MTPQHRDIEEALALFLASGQWTELRALRVCGRLALSSFHQASGGLRAMAAGAIAYELQGAKGVYFVPNPLREDIGQGTKAASDSDVIARRWLLVDVDSQRPAGTSATDAERQAAWEVAGGVKEMLENYGFLGLVTCDSGNGFHVMIPVDLPNDEASKTLCRSFLRALSKRSTSGGAKVDASVYNAARIVRLYGTRAQKGERSTERPHRWSGIVEKETWAVTKAQRNNERMRALLSAWEEAERGRKPLSEQQRQEAYARTALEREIEKLATALVGTRADQLFKSACALSELCHSGLLYWDSVKELLIGAAARCGLDEDEDCNVEETIRRANERYGNKARSKVPDFSENGGPSTSAKEEYRRRRSDNVQDDSLVTIQASTLSLKPLRWLVPGYLPLGKLVLWGGDGGNGKSMLSIHLAAGLTTGKRIFGAEDAIPPCDVLLIGCEDDPEDTVGPRLLAAGANRDRVHLVKGIRDVKGNVSPFSLMYVDALQNGLRKHPGTRLVVIDPAAAFVGRSQIDDHKDSDLRALLAPLSEIAAEEETTILLIVHFNKAASGKATHRISGSAGYVNAVRAAFIVAPDDKERERRLFLPMKFNLCDPPPGLAYRFETPDAIECKDFTDQCDYLSEEDIERLSRQLVRIRFDEGTVDVSADEALNAVKESSAGRRVKDCAAWLIEKLGEYAYPSAELFELAAKAGFNRDLCYRVRKEELIEELKIKKLGMDQGWMWGIGDPESWTVRPTPEDVEG